MFDLFEKWDGTPKPNETGASQSTPEQGAGYSSYNPLPASSGKTFVLSVGGSVFFDEKLRAPEIAKFCEVLNELVREGYRFAVVVGGGRIARVYQAGAKAMGANNFELDEVGISVCRANALFFTYGIETAWKQVLADPKEAERIMLLGKTPVFGGTTPGQATDAVAALIAELLGADFINLSNVDGIYSADPAKESHARMFKELSHLKMVSLIKAQASKPGSHIFVDPHAANIMARSRIRGVFINGSDLENFKNVVRGLEFKGTLVHTASADDVPVEEPE